MAIFGKSLEMDFFLSKCLLFGFILSLQIHGYFGCFEEERLALLDFKVFVQFNGDDADRLLPSWNNDATSDCCEWDRVTCNSTTGHVIKLSLDNIRQIPFDGYYEDMSVWFLNISMFNPFKEMTSLNLSYNAIGEFIDNADSKILSKLNKLEHLDLSWNVLDKEVLKVLGEFSALKYLDLHNNFMAGPLYYQDISGLSNLKVLILQFNELNGTLPINYLVNFTKLEILDLSWNGFTGSIPPSIRHLSSLQALTVSKNYLNGSFPAQGLCQLQKLEELDLSQNSLQGNIPSCLSNLTSLRLLDLSANNFSGKISSSLVAKMTSLEYIDLSHNLFEGLFSFSSFSNHSKLQVVQIKNNNQHFQIETEYPNWIPSFQLKVLVLPYCNLNKLSNSTVPTFLFYQHELRVLDISHNNLKGKLDLFLGNNTRIEFLSVRNNSFVGQLHLPPFHGVTSQWIDVSENKLHGQIQSNIGDMLPYAIYLNFSKNSFQGNIPSSIGQMGYLQQIDLSFNNFDGEVPKQLVSNLVNLLILKLSDNRFHGEIFTDHYNLTLLESLHLENNHFTGLLSNVILRSFKLGVLDISSNYISGAIPKWMGDLKNLRTLAMRNNQLEGPLPCNLPFTFLDLSYNNLTGSIPSCLKLQDTWGLYLRGNKFTGSIPESIFNSSILSILDISYNSLSGKLPDSISKLPNLEVLLLKGNFLSGEIPNQLCQLNNTGLMDLSNNFFSGSIPQCLYNISFKEALDFYAFIPAYFKRTIYVYGSILLGQYLVYDPNAGYAYEDGAIDFLTKSRSSSSKDDIIDLRSGLDLSSNNLTGEIPNELGKLSQLKALNLSHNQLTGSIPTTLSKLSQIQILDLSYNRLSREIPQELSNMHLLKYFTVAHNNLSGRIPDIKPQFGRFDSSSYEGNSLLCGLPLVKSCNASI
ncbi:receptor-like protein 15 isoform X2 [Jatropha curcas]|uniref:receptor-like protein 15 isoform X2 n=1 Tax=Jatropha curcas TaxID=180498 RepID=UPI00189365C8|nr:receptor-like protein 15 isoform X2 [Jatropha curcas]